MAFLFRCDALTKSFGSRQLFNEISISFEDGERTGLIGPNGTGKSTLLKILAGMEQPDSGTLTLRRNLKLGYVPQAESFLADKSVFDVLIDAFDDKHADEHDRDAKIATLLSKIGFDDTDQKVGVLSGGWRKRLSIARQLIKVPDVLLLDEPTNHLDLEGIVWLEKLLNNAPFAFLVVSHDRYFLETVTNRTVELNPAYADGFLSINSQYSDFLEKKESYLAAQASLEKSVAGRVRREIEWLKRGAKARTTKAKGRIEEAGRLMGELADLRQRNSMGDKAELDFSATNRQTRKLLTAEKLSISLGGKKLINDLSFVLAPGAKLGLVGPNGSGKSTLIRLMADQLSPDSGTIKRAEGLRIVLFDQTRAALDQNQTLKQALAPGAESIMFRGESIHVSSWAKRFLFKIQQLDMAVRDLSGGEQARVLIARMMLQPADLLILDEPTNDLDIPSLEVLEESLADFPGALVLVTHDRFMLGQLATEILGLDGLGGSKLFPDLLQYERAKEEAGKKAVIKTTSTKSTATPVKEKPKKMSFMEQRELEQIEAKIATAEGELDKQMQLMSDPTVMADRMKMTDVGNAVAAAQKSVDDLYRRWEVLEAKQEGAVS